MCKYHCTIFPGVELMYSAINRSTRAGKACLTSIRACISGAGPLYREVQETFEGLTGGRVVEGYGLTEASPVTHCCPINGECRAGTIGVPFPDTDAKVVDQATGRRELAPGRIGELVVRGPQVMRGYWNNPAESRRALRHGWLFTGDLATMDRDGFFRIVERKKDMIKTRGENVYPRNVEEVLLRHPGVADVVVVGLPDEAAGERIKAYLVPQGERPSDADLVAWCAKSLAKFEIPQEFECRESLPKNIIGKTLRRILREEERRRKGERS
jgi:long-chain acyl-CoA synthetase